MAHELQIADRWSLTLPELSGLSHCRDAAHAGQLLAVGDRTFGLYRGPARSETPPDPVDLGALVRDLTSEPDEGSQWEAVTADATGRVFVLQEYPGHVFVFAPALDALVAALALDMPDEDGWQRAWVKDENARGEALALLKNGHVLVVKQKKPRLIEFGPARTRARRSLAGHAAVRGRGVRDRGRRAVAAGLVGSRRCRRRALRERLRRRCQRRRRALSGQLEVEPDRARRARGARRQPRHPHRLRRPAERDPHGRGTHVRRAWPRARGLGRAGRER